VINVRVIDRAVEKRALSEMLDTDGAPRLQASS
jgi:hypothetical protein